MKKIGIRQVAEKAGVSIAAVSKAFHPESRTAKYITEATLERIRKVAQELGYTPNYGAGLLRGGNTRTIGFAVSMPGDTSASFLSTYPVRIIDGLGRAAQEAGYRILLLNGGSYQDYMQIRRIDALVMASYHRTGNPQKDEMLAVLKKFEEEKYPYILINSHSSLRNEFPHISCDNLYGAELIAELLLRKKYESVGFLGELTEFPQLHHVERCEVIRKKLGRRFREEAVLNGVGNGIKPFPREVLYGFSDGWNGVKILHGRKTLPRALVCGNDMIALGAMSYCSTHGIRIPQDLAITGFDGNPNSAFSAPPLTTVCQPLEEFGRLAFEYILKKIKDPETPKMCRAIKPHLIERESC